MATRLVDPFFLPGGALLALLGSTGGQRSGLDDVVTDVRPGRYVSTKARVGGDSPTSAHQRRLTPESAKKTTTAFAKERRVCFATAALASDEDQAPDGPPWNAALLLHS